MARARAAKPAAEPEAEPVIETEEATEHHLDAGESILSERSADDGTVIAVTTEGRKVILRDGLVVERLVGPLYGWEV